MVFFLKEVEGKEDLGSEFLFLEGLEKVEQGCETDWEDWVVTSLLPSESWTLTFTVGGALLI